MNHRKFWGANRLPLFTGYAMLGAFGLGLVVGFGLG